MNNIVKVSICLVLFISSCKATKTLEGTRDGSSFEKAIIVKSIPEEYEYVSKICPDCLLLGQSLTHDNKKPFDILKFKKPNGEEVSYYFDISKFFGKAFK